MDTDEQCIVGDASAEDADPTETDPVDLVVTEIVDNEWYLALDDKEAIDIAIDAGERLISIYTELHAMPLRDRVLDRLTELVANYKTPVRFARLQAVYARLAAHPRKQHAA